jgi:glyceraldehyde-3-phosphate dehydrogenase (NADP+) (phosphorylating)
MLGTFKADVKIVDNETISVDGKNIQVVSNRDPLKLPWAELGIDIVIEVILVPYRGSRTGNGN